MILDAVDEEILRPGTDLLCFFGVWPGAVRKVYGAKKRSKFSFTGARAKVWSYKQHQNLRTEMPQQKVIIPARLIVESIQGA